MDDRRRSLRFALGLLVSLVTSPAYGKAPAPQASQPPSLEQVEDALTGWRLDEAASLLSASEGPPTEARDLLYGRLDLQRARYQAVIDRLSGRLRGSDGVSPELRVVLGAALDARGRREDASVVLDALADQYESEGLEGGDAKLWLAMSLAANDYPADANDIFREALEAPGVSPRARLEWARLFRARYNHRDASQLLEEALKADPDHPEILVELAVVDVESDRDYARATDRLKKVIEGAPECVPAHNLLARIDLENERPTAAIARLSETSLKVAPQDLRALALLATAHALLDDMKRFREIERRVLAVHPRAAAFYTTVSEHLSRMHRYAEAAALDERALALDPRHWKAHTSLGIGRSRLGDDAGAKRHLERAHEGDPYEVRTYNLLEHFYDKVGKEFEWITAGPMRVRVHRRERPVLERVVPPLLKEAYAHLAKTYGTEADPPLHIEIFPEREMFSVRSTGLPRLGAHGICFGHVITARSPSAGNFNWAEVLWHELSHVFHIQLSKSRVPRWFTEGLAILEATEGRPGWVREMEQTFRAYLIHDRLRGVADFNLAFTRARSMKDVLVAYYHAYLVAMYIKREHGHDALPEMLRAWGERRTTEQVFKEVLKVDDLAAFDAALETWLRGRVLGDGKAFMLTPQLAAQDLKDRRAAMARAPESAEAIAEVAEAQLGVGEVEASLKLAQLALEANENHAKARLVRASARYALGELVGARADLERLIEGGQDGPQARGMLGKIAARQADLPGAVSHLKRAIEMDPEQMALYRALIAVLIRADDAPGAHRWRKRLLQVEQGDPTLVMTLLESAQSQGASADEVWRWAERGLHVAPFNGALQLRAAQELARLGDRSRARLLVQVALAGDPKLAGAKALADKLGL
ncbi:MAG: hypothetical protein CL940_09560 [Deltaproteobacteria bacterium]|nr:hypothetical protein [Deltaproteobacteria bacterium]